MVPGQGIRQFLKMFVGAGVFAGLVVVGSTVSADPNIEFVLVPGGTFVMGDAEEGANEAPREVTVPFFRLMRTEVTKDQFAALLT